MSRMRTQPLGSQESDGPSSAPPVDLAFVDDAVQRLGNRPEALIPILQSIQAHYRYLPRQALERLSHLAQIDPATISGVATFYAGFRHRPAGKHTVRVCHGTACHVKGIERVEDSLRRHLQLEGEQDTDTHGTFTVERVGCLGCCTLAPVVQVDNVTYGHRTPEGIVYALKDFLAMENQRARAAAQAAVNGGGLLTKLRNIFAGPEPSAAENLPEIRIGCGSCCVAGGADSVRLALEQAIRNSKAAARVTAVGCSGMCHQTPLVEIAGANGGVNPTYAKVSAIEATDIVRRHFKSNGFFGRLRTAASQALDHITGQADAVALQRHSIDVRDGPVCGFLGPQIRIATEDSGAYDPLDLDAYIAHHGFAASRQCAEELEPADVIDMVLESGLRGRGGAGFPTGQKWSRVRSAVSEDGTKYVICNGDEGDPGAFMDRMLLESFPFRVMEGMIIAAYAVGAAEAIFYIRHEYPLAVRRIRQAIELCNQRGILGPDALGDGQPLAMRIVEGAGAFVCGEETALIASIEGRRGQPRLKPPYPADRGLWDKPTCINNVETYSLTPWIIRRGPAAFAAIGTANSKGTKVFALTGKIRRGGLIEVPMGVSIRQIVDDIGGGVADGRRFKAVQIGGPSGGCIPAELADLPVDFESLSQAGAIMGSGGLVVLDDRDCMVDIARYFLRFTQAESCGKCSFCRMGTKALLDILDRLCQGKGKPSDLKELEQLSSAVKSGSICGLGQTAPNPVLTTLRYFHDEYEAHLKGHCPAGKCKGLIRYLVTDQCFGCTRCAQVCPVNAIPLLPYQKHTIDDHLCTRCDMCRTSCPVDAIEVV